MKTGCPYCSNKRVNDTNNLAITTPEIARQWHPIFNGDDTPAQYPKGSHKSVWWLCDLDHEWQTEIRARTRENHPTGCPYCSLQTSRAELRLFCELNGLFSDAIWRHKIKGMEVDVFLPTLNIAIEYDGYYWHKNQLDRDKNKNNTFKKLGIILIRIRENPLKSISHLDLLTKSQGIQKTDIDKLLQTFSLNESKYSLSIEDYKKHTNFQSEEEYKKALSRLPYPSDGNSLLTTHPKLSAEWDEEKNAPLLPYAFSSGSHYKAWWVCPNSHSYQSQIQSRTRGNACPICANKIVTSENNFSATHSDIASEWHPKNTQLPSEFVSGIDYYAWWCCSKNSTHEWQASIKARTRPEHPTGCPYCSGRLADKENNLLVKFPDVAREWNPTKNGNLSTDTVTPKSDQKVWWICLKHKPPYEWETSVKHRTLSNSGCPKCGRLKVAASHKLKVQQIDSSGNVLRSWNSVRECADALVLEMDGRRDSAEKAIARVCRKERNSWKAMRFRYLE